MQVQDEDQPYDEINVVPMLDLAYVLMIIFIIMTTAAIQGIKVNLPQASEQPAITERKTRAITVTETGQVYLDAYPVSLDELRAQLTAAKAAAPDLPVVVKGDTVVQYGRVMEVLDLLGQVGITQMGLVTQPVAK